MHGLNKLSLRTTNIVRNMELHQLLGAASCTLVLCPMRKAANLLTGMNSFFLYEHIAESLSYNYKQSTRSIWREFGRPFCLLETLELANNQILSMQGLVM